MTGADSLQAALIAARCVHFAAVSVMAGAPAMARLAGPGATDGDGDGRRVGWLVAAVVALASGAAWVAAEAGQMSGDPADALRPSAIGDVLAHTSVGHVWIVRFAVLMVGLALGLWPQGRRWLSARAAVGLAAAASLAWAGHGAADEGVRGWIHVLADAAHLAAAGLWLGALPVLLVLAFGPPPRAARALAAFSGVGPALVAVLVATGLVNGWLLVGWGPLAALAGSPYVRLLAIKLVLFAGMLALAALNRLRLTAAVAREAEAALPALRASLAIETALGLAVLAVVAALGVTAPPTSF
ncbi:MAG: copper homeostasis membrane protein CopD [Proteobacteria bacterium]|nr:copper homeostasis membrane protein CopD [Pseudomonadota bacterium]